MTGIFAEAVGAGAAGAGGEVEGIAEEELLDVRGEIETELIDLRGLRHEPLDEPVPEGEIFVLLPGLELPAPEGIRQNGRDFPLAEPLRDDERLVIRRHHGRRAGGRLAAGVNREDGHRLSSIFSRAIAARDAPRRPW